LDNIHGKMDLFMLGIFLQDWRMVEENGKAIIKLKGIHMKENTRMIRSMAMELLCGQVEICTKDSTKRMKERVMEKWDGQTGASILDIGLEESKMDMEKWFSQMAEWKKDTLKITFTKELSLQMKKLMVSLQASHKIQWMF
jgi:hypothetical protein